MTISPGKAKELGNLENYRLYSCTTWGTLKVSLMKQLLQVKFSNNALRDMLDRTETAELIEANWWGDTFWGVTVDENGKTQGENILSKLIMEVRQERTIRR